jgi:uncharacterized protein
MRVPPTERRGLTRWRVIAIVGVVVLGVGILSLRALAFVYTDELWFSELGFSDTWRGLFWAKAAPALTFTGIFFVVLLANLVIADRLAPRLSTRDLKPSGQEDLVLRYRRVVGPYLGRIRVVVALVFALIAGFGVWSRWHDWVLFRHSQSFGIEDPQFGRDVGFYIFELPFWKFAFEWTFASLIIVIIVTIVAHYFNGGIRVQGTAQRVTPQVKVHLSVLLALVALVRAWGYWLERYELALSTNGAVHGAGYTDLHARLPAKHLLIIISIAAVVLFVANIWLKGWALPVIAVGLWAFVSLSIGTVYPSIIQRFRVEPNEFDREEELIGRNIEATRHAYGLDGVDDVSYDYRQGGLTSEELEAARSSLDDARIWDPGVILQRYKTQEIATYYRFGDVDLDRYVIDGELRQTTIAPRELNPEQLPSRSWVNQRLTYTHGYGLVMSPANTATSDGDPDYLIDGIPPDVAPDAAEVLRVTEPRLYFGEAVGGYAIVGAETQEFDYPTVETVPSADAGTAADGATTTTGAGADDEASTSSAAATETTVVAGDVEEARRNAYSGSGGIELSGLVRQAAFALRLWDYQPALSGQIDGDSRIIINRDIKARVEAAAPFLEFDADPYPVLVDGGIQWVIDGYTVTDDYPFAQAVVPDGLEQGTGLNRRLNYVRNSVRAVVDAYDGTVTFYVVDDSDPMIRAYMDAFPDMFTPGSEVPEELAAHFRHPEDLFRIQSQLYRSYHTVDPAVFFRRTDQWQLAADPRTGLLDNPGDVATTASTTVQTAGGESQIEVDERNPMAPEYLMMRLPNSDTEEFVLVQPFVPVNSDSQNLRSLLIARNDGEHIGELVSYTMPNGVEGPAFVASNIQAADEISRRFTDIARQGTQSQVIQGALQPYLVGGSIVYVRPVYLRASGSTSLPTLTFVIAYNDRRVVAGDTIDEALDNLADAIRADGDGTDGTPVDGADDQGGTSTTTTPGGSTSSTVPAEGPAPETITDPDEALRQAVLAGQRADDADARGDNIGYLQQLELQQAYLARWDELVPDTTSTSVSSTTTSTTTESTAPPA